MSVLAQQGRGSRARSQGRGKERVSAPRALPAPSRAGGLGHRLLPGVSASPPTAASFNPCYAQLHKLCSTGPALLCTWAGELSSSFLGNRAKGLGNRGGKGQIRIKMLRSP